MTRGDDLPRANAGLSVLDTENRQDLSTIARPNATAPGLELSINRAWPGLCVVELAGELDALTCTLLMDCVREQLAAAPVSMVIDLDAVTFLGSAGLAALVQCSQWLAAAVPGARLQLSGTTHRVVHRPLRLLGLLALFDVHSTSADALAKHARDAGVSDHFGM